MFNLLSRLRRVILLLLCIGLIGGVATACSSYAASVASCAFVVGDAAYGQAPVLKNVVYPGQTLTVSEDVKVTYVPCNSRNFIINDGSVINANNEKVGDRPTPTLAYTSDGTPVTIWTTTAWTLNQSLDAMEKFYTLCFKYNCASSDDSGGGVNFSTPGWNGMLGENFGSVIDRLALKATQDVDDSVWKNHSPDEYDKLGKTMSAGFQDAIRAKVGFSQDLFCGSGNSAWTDPSNPGAAGNSFTCSSVRITVDRVDRGNTADNSKGQQTLNAQRLADAKALYGADAPYWLGLQDTVDKCRAAAVACSFNIGDPKNAPANK